MPDPGENQPLTRRQKVEASTMSRSELRMRASLDGECPICFSATGMRAMDLQERIDALEKQISELEYYKEKLENDLILANAMISYLRG